MPRMILHSALLLLLLTSPVLAYESLQALYEQAEPSGEYDRYIELDPQTEYLGDLHVSVEENVRLIGNGALIHGRPYNISIGVFFGTLDVSNCVVIGGGYGIYFSTGASGSAFANTISGCSEYGISTIYQDEQIGVEIWDNIITDCQIGFYCIELHHPEYLDYNTIYSTTSYRYAEFCPD